MPCTTFSTCTHACIFLNYCIKHEFPTVTLAEVREPSMVRAIRETCALVAEDKKLAPSKWHDFLVDENRDYKGTLLDSFGMPKQIDLSLLDATDQQIDNGDGEKVEEQLREFFRTNTCRPLTNDGAVFVTERWQKHAAVLGSIVGAVRPDQSVSWPRLRVGHANWRQPKPANDNREPRPK